MGCILIINHVPEANKMHFAQIQVKKVLKYCNDPKKYTGTLS